MATIGVLHPGEMGSAIAAAARANGARVVWASAGRGAATGRRAEADGLEDVGSVDALVEESAMILSVCPPAAAFDVARQVAVLRFRGVYVDANAVSPDTARSVGALLAAGGATFVDGGIIGPPPRRPGVCRLYVSGPAAAEVVAVFAQGPLQAIVLAGGLGAASALKMAYAGWNKGAQALLMAVRALAAHEGVEDALLREWALSMPDLPGRSESAVAGNVRKAWRFVGEMDEIAATFGAAGLPAGFHEAAAAVYRRLAEWKDTADTPSVAEVMKALAPDGDRR